MYLRHTIRKKDGKVHRYWCLVRSVRVGRRVIQQTVAHLGELDEHGRVEARALAHRLIGTPEQAPLFDDGSEHLTVPVRLKGIRVERSRQFGDVYLALALWRGTGLEELCGRLLAVGKERIAWARIGTGAQRSAICCSSGMRRSIRIAFIAASIICSCTNRPLKRICPSAAASCLRSRTTCCSMMLRVRTSKARRKPTRWHSAAIPAIIAPTASRC